MANDYGVKGTDLQFTATSTSAFVSVGQVRSIDAPGMKVGKRNATHLLSPIKKYRATMGDPQELRGTLIYDPSDDGVKGLQSRCTTPSTLNSNEGDSFKIILPTTTKVFAFNGFITEFTPRGGDEEGTWMADFAIQASSTIVYPTS